MPANTARPVLIPKLSLNDDDFAGKVPSPVQTHSSFMSKFPAFRRTSSSQSSVHDWASNGYATLPPNPHFVLLDLKGPEVAPEDIVPSYKSQEAYPGRFIPQNCGFTLEFQSTAPSKASVFELKELAPALFQAGKYKLEILWMADHSGLFMNIAAQKLIEIKMHKKVLARSMEDNHMTFVKKEGHAHASITKEGWFHRAEDRPAQYKWQLVYTPHRHKKNSAIPDTEDIFIGHTASGSSASSSRSSSRSSSASLLLPSLPLYGTPPSYIESPKGDYFSEKKIDFAPVKAILQPNVAEVRVQA